MKFIETIEATHSIAAVICTAPDTTGELGFEA